jgi:predicted DNA-binding WGR domain protein
MEIYFENRTWPHAKFYRLEIELVLFDVCLKREWGRIGRKKREKVDHFKTWKEADKQYQRLYRRRIRRGYTVVADRKWVAQLEIPFENVSGYPELKNKKTTLVKFISIR